MTNFIEIDADVTMNVTDIYSFEFVILSIEIWIYKIEIVNTFKQYLFVDKQI